MAVNNSTLLLCLIFTSLTYETKIEIQFLWRQRLMQLNLTGVKCYTAEQSIGILAKCFIDADALLKSSLVTTIVEPQNNVKVTTTGGDSLT